MKYYSSSHRPTETPKFTNANGGNSLRHADLLIINWKLSERVEIDHSITNLRFKIAIHGGTENLLYMDVFIIAAHNNVTIEVQPRNALGLFIFILIVIIGNHNSINLDISDYNTN